MKKTIKLTPADPYLNQWKELWLQKEYEPDAWERSKWQKMWEIEEIKDEEDEYVSASEKKFLKEWQDIARAAETNVALKDLLDQVKMMYKLIKIK
jgi:DNA phosphorothioation-dependent restriction protein DptG